MMARGAGRGRAGRVGVVVPAAGSGTRMAGATPGAGKAFLELCGEPLLLHAIRPFLADPRVVSVVAALPPALAESPPTWLSDLDPRVVVAAGGATRSQSVRAGIGKLPADVDVIAVHDAARPLVTAAVVSACIDLALAGGGAVAGSPAVDTLKRVDRGRRVVETPDRAELWHAQTPQVFPASVLRAVYANPSAEATDDAALVERFASGTVVTMVDAGASNLKITRPEDVAMAEAILRRRGS
jgi:2-C-methyl-D-erythritol 4-phosphate cytidylyltransferase